MSIKKIRGDSPCSDGDHRLAEEMKKSQKIGNRTAYVETEMEVNAVLGIFTHSPRNHILSRASVTVTSQLGFSGSRCWDSLGYKVLMRDQHTERKGGEARMGRRKRN